MARQWRQRRPSVDSLTTAVLSAAAVPLRGQSPSSESAADSSRRPCLAWSWRSIWPGGPPSMTRPSADACECTQWSRDSFNRSSARSYVWHDIERCCLSTATARRIRGKLSSAGSSRNSSTKRSLSHTCYAPRAQGVPPAPLSPPRTNLDLEAAGNGFSNHILLWSVPAREVLGDLRDAMNPGVFPSELWA